MNLLYTRDSIDTTELFDLCSGTSIGSVNALGAAFRHSDVSFSVLKENLTNNIDRVFHKSNIRLIFDSIFASGPLFQSTHLKFVLDEIFHNKRISDTHTGFLCTASNLSGFGARTISNFDGDQSRNLPCVDAAMSSCAAPIYFAPHGIREIDQMFIDGGVWANNPVLAAILSANRFKGIPFKSMRVISVGTGSFPTGASAPDLMRMRPASLAAIALVNEIYNASQMDASLSAAGQLIGAENITSINPALREPISLFDARRAVELLPAYAEEAYEQHRNLFLNLSRETARNEPLYENFSRLADDEMIFTGGLSRLIPKRKYYRKFRNESGDIETYLKSARKSITMVSINMQTGIGFENVTRVFEEKLNSDNKFSVIVSLLNPDNSELMNVVSDSISDEYAKSGKDLSTQISDTLSRLITFKGSLSKSEKTRFTLKKHDTFTFGSAIILDGETDAGRIQIETKAYRTPLADSFAFEWIETGPDSLFVTLKSAYGKLVNDATELN